MNKQFKIDFFELMFLAQMCIPPVPIARSMFWQDLCDVHYHEMSDIQRKRMLNSIIKQDNFNLDNDDCNYFFCRFYKFNQYVIDAIGLDTGHTGTQINAFKVEDKYHVSKSQSVNKSCIVGVKLLHKL